MDTHELLRRMRRALDTRRESGRTARPDVKGKWEPQPGDLVAMAPSAAEGVLWALIRRHPDDAALVCAVPADMHLASGREDVLVPAGLGHDSLALRCGLGLWVRDEDLVAQQGHCVARLADTSLSRAAERLEAIDRGIVSQVSAPGEEETDAYREFGEWKRHVATLRTQLLDTLELSRGRRPGKILHLRASDFTKQPVSFALRRQTTAVQYLKAAHSGGLGEDVEKVRALSGSAAPPSHLLQCNAPGKVFAFLDAEGIYLLYLPKVLRAGPKHSSKSRLKTASALGEKELPVIYYLARSGRYRKLRWERGAHSTAFRATPVVPWIQKKARIRIGVGSSQVIEIEQ